MTAKAEPVRLNQDQEFLEKIREFAVVREVQGFNIPRPFGRSAAGYLAKWDDKDESMKPICRDFPVITQELTHIETGEVLYTLEWSKGGRKQAQTVPARQISTRMELVKLADLGLAVHDNNAKDLISYFAQFQMENADTIPEARAVGRLGYINSSGKQEFVHPLRAADAGITIATADIGERQTLEGFQAAGTSAEWMEHVFEKVKHHPKALALTLSSFASVLLADLNLSPFIVDLSGITSRGKTTALRVAASVWGTDRLMNEWNATKVSIERKAAFLNSFPALYDDTMKAHPQELQKVIYNFSGGKSKGRGSIKGSQAEYTWKNLLISTGENSLIEYAKEAGGAAARVLPLNGLPFGDTGTHDFFNGLYSSLERYHGQIGLDFLDRWQAEKSELIGLYHGYKQQFQEAAGENEVMARIALHYAAIVYTGHLLNVFFDAGVDLDSLVHLFGEVKRENKAIDKPLQRLEEILTNLDADRVKVWYENDAVEPRDCAALFNKGHLHLLPGPLNDFLGADAQNIRREWLRRGFVVPGVDKRSGKATDWTLTKHHKQNKRTVILTREIVKELGFDFKKQPRNH